MAEEKTTVSQKLQKFGAFLAGMVIPNIGAFIGFGLITAFFLETGWTPNEKLALLITPILNNLLPILIGHTGGKMTGGDRGGVIGALVTMGAIVAVDGTPMFLAAMILGPLSGWVIKKFDQAVDGKIPGGFEMIVNNFSLGIIGAILCCIAMLVFGPVMETVTSVLTNGVNWIVEHNALPLSAIFVEPAKVLFLNNALDHGIFGPIGYEQVKTLGHSALFMLVPNPGAGLGLLLAYWFFGKGEMKDAAPGMILIHFFGGIHEVYFPYVLSNPLTIIGMIAGGIVGTGTLTILDVGTVATPSPGSIFSVIALSPPNCMFGVILSVILSCIVSLVVNAFFVKRMVAKGGDTSLGESVIPKEAMGSSESEGSSSDTAVTNDSSLGVDGLDISKIKKIVVACDAGMGSSAMSAAALKKKVKAENLPIEVINTAISRIPDDADLVITHVELTGTAKAAQPNKQHLSISNYLKAPEYDQLVERLKSER
ncbi:MAG TPA: PTS mannitol transporter subunit IICB [Candidatus Anaerostipes avistercoris]|uniref:PTS system mannitol-specific EIICB component n=1 Tax=Candidatus Anaerostipes avistercoris TaxID=2838462 RepID=A0A9D2T8A4_9FIRM|nr:PTS mannitol transporter subunit IICB [Candidatus Anaerostipes avistercoris]